MNNIIFQLLPAILLIILYVVIFSRRGEVQRVKMNFRGHDWITFISAILGATILAGGTRALGLTIPPLIWAAILILFVVVLLVVVLRRARTGKPILKRLGDERINLIYAKSARNAFFATYLTFFIHQMVTSANSLDTTWFSITLGCGLIVLIGSSLIYYYT